MCKTSKVIHWFLGITFRIGVYPSKYELEKGVIHLFLTGYAQYRWITLWIQNVFIHKLWVTMKKT